MVLAFAARDAELLVALAGAVWGAGSAFEDLLDLAAAVFLVLMMNVLDSALKASRDARLDASFDIFQFLIEMENEDLKL